jgi:spore coat polysaccharide biosynthesis predicted glycosyltransferase SpsG
MAIGPDDGRGQNNDRSGAPADAQVLRDPTDLDRLLATASLVVSGAGTMKFELGLLGRPMILLAVADDQRPVGPAFAATGAARYLGDGRTIDPATVAAEVATLVADGPARAAMASRGPTVVDGRGADRIADAVLRLASRPGRRAAR